MKNLVLFISMAIVLSFLLLKPLYKKSSVFSEKNSTYTFQVLIKKEHNTSGAQRLRHLKYVKSVETFDPYPSDFFSRLYDVTVTSETAVRSIKNLPFVEGIHRPIKVQTTAIYPPKQGSLTSNDTFINHQWALKNIYIPGDETVTQPELAKGHLVRKDLTDIQVKFLNSRPADGSRKTYDIDYTKEVQNLAYAKGKDLIIAVIDSGVDWTHPELKDSLFRKPKECQNGSNLPKPVKDVDGNGYDNDCMGWNFTAAKSSPARNRPFDTLGHGTHIAGILAATANNHLGVRGVSSRLKIMPLKVVGYGSDIIESDEFDPNEFDGFTSQVAKAVRYATHEGAEVINLSLGWPRVANVDIVQEAIKEALEKNITIIAASGNNGHTSKIMPCSMNGVICVGAINNDGTVADYSNYGGHVDVLAPGHGILSTYPQQMTPNTFDVTGYEVLNGTSQATPYVVGLVALMKLKFPGIHFNEIRARLMSTARPVFMELDEPRLPGVANHQSLAGAIQYASALSDDWSSTSVVVPLLKGSPLIKYQPNTLSARLQIPIEVLGAQAKDVTIQIVSGRKDLKLQQSKFHLGDLKPSETPSTTIDLRLTLASASVDSEWVFDIEIYQKGTLKRSIRNFSYLSRDLETDSSVVKVVKSALDENTFDYRPVVDIRRILPNPSVFTSQLDKKNAGIRINIHTVTDNGLLQVSREAFIPNLHQRPRGLGGPQFQLFAEDFNEDGQPDYLIVGIFSNKEGDFVQLSYFRHDLKPLYGEHSHWSMKLKHAAPDFKDIKFMELSLPRIGKVKTPVFVTEGTIPDRDKAPKIEFIQEQGISQGIYTIEPYWNNGKIKARVRRLDSFAYKNKLRAQLGITDTSRMVIVGLLTQSASDFIKSKVTALYSYGPPSQFQYALVSLKEQTLRNHSTGVSKFTTQRYLTDNQMLPVMDLSGPHPKSNQGTIFVDTLQYTRLRSVYFDHNDTWEFQQDLRYTTDERAELILGAIRGFTKNGQGTVFLETGYKTIALVGHNAPDSTFYKRKINRSTFLPGYFFSEIMQPTSILTPRGHEPALYVDATAILSGNIILWHVGKAGAKAPAKFNLQIPKHCRTIEKMYWRLKRADSVIIDCNNKDESYFLVYPLVE